MPGSKKVMQSDVGEKFMKLELDILRDLIGMGNAEERQMKQLARNKQVSNDKVKELKKKLDNGEVNKSKL